MCSTLKTAYMSFKLPCFAWQAVHACDKPQQSWGKERYKPLGSLFNRLLPSEQTGLLSTVNLALGVNESCWHVGRCHYPTAHGGEGFANQEVMILHFFLPPGLAFLSGLREHFLLSLQRSTLVHQLQQSQLLLYTAKIKTRITNIPHNPLSTEITLLFNTEDFYYYFFLDMYLILFFWVDFGKINISDEVRGSKKWFPRRRSSRLEEGELLADYPS